MIAGSANRYKADFVADWTRNGLLQATNNRAADFGSLTGVIGSFAFGGEFGLATRTAKADDLSRLGQKFAAGSNLLRQTGSGNFIGSADEAYDAIRASTTDVEAIAGNTGFKPSNIQKVKDHMFYNEQVLDRYVSLGEPVEYRRFYSDLGQAQAWQRLELGTHTAQDIQLLRHETAEAWYMRNVAPGYNAAHNAAQARFPAPRY